MEGSRLAVAVLGVAVTAVAATLLWRRGDGGKGDGPPRRVVDAPSTRPSSATSAKAGSGSGSSKGDGGDASAVSAPGAGSSAVKGAQGLTIVDGSREMSFTLPGITLAARVWGRVTANERIIALHGWLDNAATFDLVAPFLVSNVSGNEDNERCVVALDAAGHGWSGHRPAGAEYNFMDYVADVSEVAAVLGWDSFHLVGHSLGGSIAMVLAGTFPERVRTLTMLESIGPQSTPVEQMPSELAAALSRKRPGPARVHANMEAAAQRLSQGMMRTPLAASRVLVGRGTRRARESGYEGAPPATPRTTDVLPLAEVPSSMEPVKWSSDPLLLARSRARFSEDMVAAFIKAITCPVLIVSARDGLFSVMPWRTRMTSRENLFSTLQTHLQLPEGGHHCHLLQPRVVGEAVRDFIRAPE